MFNLKHKLPIWIMGAFAVMAFLSTSYFWEFLEIHIHQQSGELFCPGHLFVIAIYVTPVLLGWLYLMFWKDQLKPRLHYFWTTYGLFIISWLLLVHLPFSMAKTGKGLEMFLTEVDTFYWGLGFGILYAFYSLKSAKPLWYFMLPIGILGILGCLGSLGSLSDPKNLTWVISDLIVVGSMAVVTLFFLASGIRNFIKRRKKRSVAKR